MSLNNCFKLGQIVKAHGIKGEVVAELDEEHPEEYSELESVFVSIDQKLIPFFIEEIQVHQKRAIIKFEDVESIDDTPLLLRKEIYIASDQLPEEGDYFHEAITGYLVKDKAKGEIGPVKDYIERPGQDLLVVDYNGKEVYIPVDASIITKNDRKKRILHVKLPEGLLDL